ncbi:MAG: HNH endonuclease [Acidimicrobiales bacterium]
MTTAPIKGSRPAPYDDEFDSDGLLTYRYRGTDPNHRDNVGLRQTMIHGKGLIYLHGLEPGWYQATWPVFVIEDHPSELAVKVMMADPGNFTSTLDPGTVDVAERRYYEVVTRKRLHQAEFRQRVLRAYRRSCGFCSLKHTELLDAAHIKPDGLGGSTATSNGLALCKIHHAAFDQQIVGIRPDLVLQVRQDVLDEVDGPMLRHGLQALDQQKLLVPHRPLDRPNVTALEERYESFLAR